jgi:hypothetical protein
LHKNLSPVIYHVGGRKSVKKVFDHCPTEKRKHIVFCADLDTWVFAEVPEEYQEIHFTQGYSIENDLFADGEQALMNLLRPNERELFERIMSNVADWFAFEAEKLDKRRLTEGEIDSDFEDISIIQEIEWGNGSLKLAFLEKQGYVRAGEPYASKAKTWPTRTIRGKFIFAIFIALDKQRQEGMKANHSKKGLWLQCIAEGLSNRPEPTNCQRIAQLLASIAR